MEQTDFYEFGDHYLILIQAAGGVYDFRNFEQI